MQKTPDFPKTDRLSVITASIIMGYSFLPYVKIPPRQISFSIFGFILSFNLQFATLISLITAGIAAAGMDWMLRERGDLDFRDILPHLILPALTAGTIGIPLGFIAVSLDWWVILGLGSLLVLSTLVGEYISIDKNHPYFPIALVLLTALSFSLFLIIVITIRAANLRLFLTASILPVVYAFFGVRVLQLRLGGVWPLKWTLVIFLVIGQITIGLYYWPLSPVRFGLLLLAPAYALIGIASSLEENTSFRDVYLEPLVVMVLLILLAFVIG